MGLGVTIIGLASYLLRQHEESEQPQQQAALGEGCAGYVASRRRGGEEAQPAERLRHLG